MKKSKSKRKVAVTTMHIRVPTGGSKYPLYMTACGLEILSGYGPSKPVPHVSILAHRATSITGANCAQCLVGMVMTLTKRRDEALQRSRRGLANAIVAVETRMAVRAMGLLVLADP